MVRTVVKDRWGSEDIVGPELMAVVRFGMGGTSPNFGGSSGIWWASGPVAGVGP